MKIRNLLLIIGSILAVAAAPVMADINYTQGAGTVIFDFTCFTTKHCSGHVPINSAGTESATSGNPFRVDPTGATTQPVSAASLPLPTGAATAANQVLEIAAINSSVPTGANVIGQVGQVSQYPFGAVPITNSATGTTAATTATLAGAVGKTTYICSLSVRANATANTNVTDTVTGVISGTLSRALWVPANTAGLGVDEMIYNPCVPASATNTAIAVVSGAPGAGGAVTVNATGYQL